MNDEALEQFHQCFSHQDWDGAERIVHPAVRADPGDWNAIYLLGVVRRFKGDFTGAIELYKRALQLNADDAAIWQALGVALQQVGDHTAAIDALWRALRIDRNFYAAHNSLGLTYKLVGDYQSAMRAYDNAIQVRANLTFAEVRRSHPEIFHVEQRGERQVLVIDPSYSEHMRQILVTDFDYFNTMKNMITCCTEMGDHARARELQEHVDNCTPIDADIIGPIKPSTGA